MATANFIEYDWSTIENAVYVHDFPRTSSASSGPSAFRDTLVSAHKSLGTPLGLYETLNTSFDFTTAADIRLILSVPGNHKGVDALQSNGHTGLAKALQDLDVVTPFHKARLTLECQGSSIGSYTRDWIRSFYRSALGWDPSGPDSNGLKTESSRKRIPTRDDEWPDVKIVYPTLRTVKESLGGPAGGGTLFCPINQWGKAGFPRDLFRDSRSLRPGLLQHVRTCRSSA